MSLDFIATIRPYLEAAYFAAGILLLVGLTTTFYQVTLIKNDIKLRNERAAKERAIEGILRYFRNYVPESDLYFREAEEKKLKSYSGPIGNFSIDSTTLSVLTMGLEKLKLPHSYLMLNELEAVAAYFTTGVADEGTGFQIIGRTYCYTVESAYDLIAVCRRENAHAYWQNIVSLYQLWRPRLTKAQLQTTIQELEAKIRHMD